MENDNVLAWALNKGLLARRHPHLVARTGSEPWTNSCSGYREPKRHLNTAGGLCGLWPRNGLSRHDLHCLYGSSLIRVTGVLRPHCLPFLIFACRRIGLLTLEMRARLSYCERVDRAGPVMGSRRTSRIRHSRNFVALGQVDEDTWQRVQVAGRVKSIAESRR